MSDVPTLYSPLTRPLARCVSFPSPRRSGQGKSQSNDTLRGPGVVPLVYLRFPPYLCQKTSETKG